MGAPVVVLDGDTMGTSWSVRLVGDAGLRDAIERVLDRVVRQMSHWEPESDLSRFNRSTPGRWQLLPAAFNAVLQAALRVAEASDGAFDPAIGRLVDLWGFGPPGPQPMPDAAAVRAALSTSGWRRIEQDAATARARRLGAATLDLSGIAKGHAVDAVAEALSGSGVADYLVEIGGELRGAGIKPDGQPWWVDVEGLPGLDVAPIRVALHGLSVATSGDYRRSFEADGRRFAHTLDPRTGMPTDNGVASVTVLHASCMLADAWATALGVLGPEGIALAGQQRLAVHMVLRSGAEYLSPALTQMLG